MLDDLERALGRELREVAADVRVPPMPSLPQSRSRGWRHWQPALAAASVVLVVAGAVAVATSRGAQEPDPAPPSPSRTAETPVPRTAPQVPYVLGGSLFVDGESLPGIWASVRSGPLGWVALRADGSWWWGRGPDPHRLASDLEAPPVLSPSGEYVAYLVAEGGQTIVTGFDTDPAGEGLGGLPVDPGSAADGSLVRVRAVTDDGRVIAQGIDTSVLWLPLVVDAEPVDLAATAPGQQVLGGTGAGLVVTDGAGGVVDGTTGRPYLADLADDGTLRRLADLPTHDDLLLSPAGTWLVRTPPGTTGGDVTAVAALEAQSLDGERRTTLTPPEGWDFRVRAWAWEDDRYVVAPVVPAGAEPGDDGGESVVRCDVVSGECAFVDLP